MLESSTDLVKEMNERNRVGWGEQGHAFHGTWHGWSTGGTVSIGLIVTILLLAPATGAVTPTKIYKAPFKGGVLPTSYLNTYGCHAKATQLKAWNFNMATGIGGGADSASSKACTQVPYRLGSQSQAQASGSMEDSIAVKVPKGFHNVSAEVQINVTESIKEATGSLTNTCPTTPYNTISGQYNNGSAWTYYPNFHGPIVYTNKTYYYESTSRGAQGLCGSSAQVSASMVAVVIAANGLAGFGLSNSSLVSAVGTGGFSMSGPSISFGGYVSTINSTYWNCYNYTQWNYGTWSNYTGPCSSSNNTYTNSWAYKNGTVVYNTNSSMTVSESVTMVFSWFGNYSVSPVWDVFLIPGGTTSTSTYYYAHGAAVSVLNMGTGGNGLTLKWITVT